jgi:DNA-binding transcriptional LysR family regulator
MEMQQLRALVSVAEAGSVTEAARRLFLTQPAVTRQIRGLEEELGGSLFDRAKKPIVPTPLGKSALAHARRILQMSEDLRALVSSEAGTIKGELRVGISFTLAQQVIAPLTLALRQRFPGLQLRLKVFWSGIVRREVEEGQLDAAIVLAPRGAPPPAAVVARKLAPEPATAVASTRTHLKGVVTLEQLRGVPWVLNPDGCGYRARLKRALEEAGIPFEVAVEVLFMDLDLQLKLIREGVGAGIVPMRALPPRLQATGLQTFRISTIDFALEVWLLHRDTGSIMPLVAPLLEESLSSVLNQPMPGPRPKTTRPARVGRASR